AESPVYQKLIETNDPIEIRDALVELRRIEPQRPTELPDAKIMANLVDGIGRTQDRIRNAEAVCTRRQIGQLLDLMVGVVAQFADVDTKGKIRDGWMNLPLEGWR